MPDVYTPSAASWNSTALVGKPGEKISAPGYADTGMKALDNLAYLTGAGTNSAIKRIAYVDDIAALKAISEGGRRDKDTMLVLAGGTLAQYVFSAAATDTSDEPYILVPNVGSGRWLMEGRKPSSNLIGTGSDAHSLHGWVIPGIAFHPLPSASNFTVDAATGSAGFNYPQNAGRMYAYFNGLNIGDKFSSLRGKGILSSGTEITVYMYLMEQSGASITCTLIDNFTLTNSVPSISISFPTITWGISNCLYFDVHVDCSGGTGGSAAKLQSLSFSTTRTFIRE